MVSDMEAAEIVRSNLLKNGFDVIDINKIAADIKAIRERKLKDEEAVKAIKGWKSWREKVG